MLSILGKVNSHKTGEGRRHRLMSRSRERAGTEGPLRRGRHGEEDAERRANEDCLSTEHCVLAILVSLFLRGHCPGGDVVQVRSD